MSSIRTPNSASSFHTQRISNYEIDRQPAGKIVAEEEHSEQCLNPVQFSLAELFWVSFVVAVVLAIATPFLHFSCVNLGYFWQGLARLFSNFSEDSNRFRSINVPHDLFDAKHSVFALANSLGRSRIL